MSDPLKRKKTSPSTIGEMIKVQSETERLLKEGELAKAFKYHRDSTGLGLKESKRIVLCLADRLNINTGEV